MKVIEYSKSEGFREVDFAPEQQEDEYTDDWLKRAGFSERERGPGVIIYARDFGDSPV